MLESLKTSGQLLDEVNTNEEFEVDEGEADDEKPEVIDDTVNLEKEEENGTRADDEMSSDDDSITTVKHIEKVCFYFLNLLGFGSSC